MIKYHPNRAVLEKFVAGELEDSVSVIVASHVEMCSECRALVNQLTEVAALEAFDLTEECLGTDTFEFESFSEGISSDWNLNTLSDETMIEMASTIAQASPEYSTIQPVKTSEIKIGNKKIPLPRAMNSIALREWQGIGKVSRARLRFDDDERRMSLLHIDKGGNIPSHTHDGFEITLLLEGSFEDEMGTYQAGDFIWLDGEHIHTPVTREGCVCLTVSSDAIHFTQGVSQLFNPLGKLIY